MLTFREMNKRMNIYFIAIWGIFLLCNCNASTELAVAEQEEPKCGFFPVGAKCTPEYQTLWGEHLREQTELQNCTSRIQQLEVASNEIKTNLTDYVAKLNHYTNEWPRFSNPDRPFTQRDVYVGASGMALGVMGLWIGQKVVGRKKEDPEITRLKNELAQEKANNSSSNQSAGQVTENNQDQSQRVDQRLNALEGNLGKAMKQLGEVAEVTEILNTEVQTVNDEMKSVKTDLESVKTDVKSRI